MTPRSFDPLLHRICVDSNNGRDSHQLRLNRDRFRRILALMSKEMVAELELLTHPDQDPQLRDTIAEATIVFLLNTRTHFPEYLEKSYYIFAAELCIAGTLHKVMSHLDMDFGPAELWQALIHFEADERTPPFTVDYFDAPIELRKRYITHGCLDASFLGNEVPDDLLDYVVDNFGEVDLLDVCSIVHDRSSFDTGMIKEALGLGARSLALGAL